MVGNSALALVAALALSEATWFPKAPSKGWNPISGSSLCKCAPGDHCWPSQRQWASLNRTVNGNLLAGVPVAESCYPGNAYNKAQCAFIDQNWSNATFQANQPNGLSYPIENSCPPVNVTAGQKATGKCTLGDNSVYIVRATCPEDVQHVVQFAKEHKIRLVVKDTGHDLLGRSNGANSLEIWIRYLRTGVEFHQSYNSNRWSGSAFTIGGGYTWADLYPLAKQHNVVVVGGGTPSVSCLGGWMQGGGHGPASREFGLGADQVLEAKVVTADARLITASPHENQDILFAVRGGGPAAYGVVVETTIKAHPMVSVQVQHLAIAPLTNDTNPLLDVVAVLYHDFPDLNDAGYAGYGSWSINQPAPLFASFTSGYVHGFYMMNRTHAEAETAFEPTLGKLQALNGTQLFVSVSYVDYPDYWSFYNTESGVEPAVGVSAALGSRLFDRDSVQRNPAGLRHMIGVIAGAPEEYTSNNFELVSGGQVFKDATDRFSGVLPAWRKAHFNSIVARGWASGSTEAVMTAVHNDITYNKAAAMEAQAPGTGVYMNEADRLDPKWETNFYGTNYPKLRAIKELHDPTGVFYCPTCVGSDMWKENDDGRLCRL
ncbi:FAD/FMN-containing protein [Acrodontium crateriforme]|uniref:FAD/FMN-containing protein n=1 Tax=Acrodontium crateriforme TaxID=150365 RepID=A0AAQ3M057_9PEZI|nr:FAD/FMN-containing protein [Acrodontium crateriforme]